MKTKAFIMAALAILTLSACDRDKTNTETGEQGYLTLSLNIPAPGTTGDQTVPGTVQENAIDHLTLVFTEEDGTILQTRTPALAIVGEVTITEEFLINFGTYYVYVLVNNPMTITLGDNIDQIVNVANAGEATSGYWNGSFFMTNERSSASDQAGVLVSISAANNINNPATATVSVNRVAAKIEDTNDYAINPPMIANLSVVTGNLITGVVVEGFVPLNVNRQFNMIQTWNPINPNGNPATLTQDILSTPLYPGGAALVAAQYFHNIGEYTTVVRDGSGVILSATDNTVGIPFSNDPVYVTENRPTISFFGDTQSITAGRGETTGVIYRVVAQNGGAEVGTFYRYRNLVTTDLSDIQELFEFSTIILPTDDFPALRSYDIQVFEDGAIYYTYFILDPNPNYQYNGENYYAVFRNSIYSLAINSISALGDDVPGGTIVDPTEPGTPGNPPIDSDEAFLDVTLNVNQWVLNPIGLDF